MNTNGFKMVFGKMAYFTMENKTQCVLRGLEARRLRESMPKSRWRAWATPRTRLTKSGTLPANLEEAYLDDATGQSISEASRNSGFLSQRTIPRSWTHAPRQAVFKGKTVVADKQLLEGSLAEPPLLLDWLPKSELRLWAKGWPHIHLQRRKKKSHLDQSPFFGPHYD